MSISYIITFGKDFYHKSYSHYRALVFRDKDGPKDSDVNLYLGKYHRGCDINIVDMDNITEDIFDNIRNNYYCYFYITTDSKKERKEIRNIIKEKCNKEVHIMLYSKIVNNIHRWNYYK